MTRLPERRAAFAVFDLFLCVGVVLPLAVVLFMVARSMINGSVQDQPPPADTTVTVNDYLRTVEHDGHWFVGPRYAGGLLHHPDCPCGGKAEEEK